MGCPTLASRPTSTKPTSSDEGGRRNTPVAATTPYPLGLPADLVLAKHGLFHATLIMIARVPPWCHKQVTCFMWTVRKGKPGTPTDCVCPPVAERALLAQWDLCRWVWNQCVAESRAAHKAKQGCGPATLDKMLTGWRSKHEWLCAGASVPQQQIIRDFGRSRAKALKDIKGRLALIA